MASASLASNFYDLLIIDINMPGNRNLEFLREIAGSPKFLPVIVATGYPTVGLRLSRSGSPRSIT